MRTTLISTSKLKSYKISTKSVGFLLILVLVAYFQNAGIFWRLYSAALFGYFGFVATRRVISLKNVSFDDYSIYYDRNDYEVQIPFSEVKNVEIMSLDGVYKINLFQPNQDGKVIYFKTSLWYPLNFKRQDEKVNELRAMIEKYKRNLAPNYSEQLPGRRI